MSVGKVAYICDSRLLEECDRSPQYIGRASLVHSLIKAYNLLDNVTVLESRVATEQEIVSFHCGCYVEFLQKINSCVDLEVFEEEAEQHGLGYDCPLLERLYDFVQVIAGGSIRAAEALVDGSAEIAINWCGGWHHAQRDGADGFCYVNDIVLAIHKLRETFKRILYIDLDAHHGDGVENAFASTPSVMSFSLHIHEPGFYPGTGDVSDVGFGRGRYYSVNVPLADGIRDDLYTYAFDSIMLKIWATFKPEAVVIQCGADGINGDPLCGWNLTPQAYGHCVKRVLTWKLPTLILGGGGYNHPNVARCWTHITSVILGCDLPSSIPEHEYLLEYGPDFEISVFPGCRRDCNQKDSLENVIKCVTENLEHIC